MSLPLRTRQLASSTTLLNSSHISSSFTIPCVHRRTYFWSGRKKADPALPVNPMADDLLKSKKDANKLVRGSLAPSSIFEDETIAGSKATGPSKTSTELDPRNPLIMAAALDPDPKSRLRWERKMVIREIHKRGRLTRTQVIQKQEREVVSKSHNISTSVKKLGPLARQIAGKTVDEAIVQMRFSKKKAAVEVRAHLEHARNEAIVRRGMGLKAKDAATFPTTAITTKDGKRIKIQDPTTLYIDQAWVGKGDFGVSPDYRARGQTHLMQNPTTHIALLIKEEATRLRQHAEREEKIRNRKVWVHLPNRPITAQRQHYSW